MAFTKNPFNNESCEYYMTVGLNSNLTEDTYKRNPMNLVICIDKSGSMGSSFNRYYYDRNPVNKVCLEYKTNLINKKTFRIFSNQNENNEFDNRSKMLITLEVVSKVIDHLKPNDRLSIITFDNKTSIIQTMKQLSDINIKDLKNEILKITADGGTNMSSAIDCCSSLFDIDSILNDNQYDNRIIFLTDGQPNEGNLGEEYFYSRIEQLSKHRIYITFIGVGIDLNTQLISSITKHRGANYFSVHNSKKFFKLLDQDFDLILTPLVFNVKLKFQSDLFTIEYIYGSPDWDKIKT